ncbi:NAD-dependent succinate-semialdehyde dehydrogenase [Desulfopila sp. IMCC35008]|uniref:NAD-dependent succinate-semialdehyde dehydrogenase n=1 Tax=Desulfopila sp. IMCC35008 TaxID=2653858 RepID=UPI0013D5D785|nr:NAD-dependent succinate-semialdehyde dehydrogenase [Desulfopila sp. IMCC35008]
MKTLDIRQLKACQAFAGGEWIEASDGSTFDVLNPASGDVVATCPDLSKSEVAGIIVKAEMAFQGWRMTTVNERSVVLRRWYELVMEHQEELARIMTAEQGRPIREARAEVAYGASFIEWFAEEAKRTYGDIIPSGANDRRLVTVKQPVGVVAAITPWNFPNAMITRKTAPAIAAGCSIIVKPARETPLSALALGYLAEKAGIPAGVVNIVTSANSRETGLELTTNPIIRKVTFTGSTQVGKILLSQASQTVKKVSMELGGNAPLVVFDDADLENAVNAALASKFRNCGQTCICANRILVQEGVYDEFVERFSSKVSLLKQGNGIEEDTDLGPLINKSAVSFVQELVHDAKQKGATVTVGEHVSDSVTGTFYPATVLRDVPRSARVFREEIFGPLAPIFKFSSEQEAIELANDTPYGLAAYLFTENIGRAWRVSEALEYGMVGVNETAISSEVIPFGGVKESGLGREGSKYGMDEYQEIKLICMGNI